MSSEELVDVFIKLLQKCSNLHTDRFNNLFTINPRQYVLQTNIFIFLNDKPTRQEFGSLAIDWLKTQKSFDELCAFINKLNENSEQALKTLFRQRYDWDPQYSFSDGNYSFMYRASTDGEINCLPPESYVDLNAREKTMAKESGKPMRILCLKGCGRIGQIKGFVCKRCNLPESPF